MQNDWDNFLDLCLSMKSRENLNRMLFLFLTPEERKDITQRYSIIKELFSGNFSQREIAEKYKVSIAKITRGSNSLKLIDEKFLEFLSKKIT